ncbi:hypothetical protein IV203_016012 [Nitzschia inconspicua]|uniref:Uncharacterized protein n=1 Tax=Nitzschia inconspicua TaxID=303405 RepID=A0A9K3PGZ3_9STRA|nr:hypothetical protein IV203_016012 [Nitzschia inconspicua]
MTRPRSIQRRRERQRRRLDSISRLSETDCTLATSLATKNEGSGQAAGVLFSLLTQQPVDLLTLEFFLSDSVNLSSGTIPNVQVYYREGADHADAIGTSSEWQMLANTDAYIINDPTPRAIIPTNKFQPLSIESGRIYALYTIFPSPSIKVKLVDTSSMGLVSSKDDIVEIQTGVIMDDSKPFPDVYSNTADFHGIVHYSLSTQCLGNKITTTVTLKFAANDEPTASVSEGLTKAVEATVSKYMDQSPSLKHFKNFHGLEMQQSRTNAEGRSEKCPPEFQPCSLFATTVTFVHASTLKTGDVAFVVMGGSDEMANDVIQQSPVKMWHGSDPVIRLEFLVTLFDVPVEVGMNPIQRRYFETVTIDLLRESSTQQIFAVSVIDEIVAAGQRKRDLSPFSLRGVSQRQSGSNGNTQILLHVTGAGDTASLRRDILNILGSNDGTYKDKLVAEQMRPAEINRNSYGNFFGDLEQVQVQITPTDFAVDPKMSSAVDSRNSAITSSTSTGSEFFSIWAIVCFLLILMSVLNILYRVYKDCMQESIQNSVEQKSHSADVTTTPPLEEENDSDIESVGIADLSEGDLESDNYSISVGEPESPKGKNNVPVKYNVESRDSSDESSVDSSEDDEDCSSGNKSDMTEDSAFLSQAPSINSLSPAIEKHVTKNTTSKNEQSKREAMETLKTDNQDSESFFSDIEDVTDDEESTVEGDDSDEDDKGDKSANETLSDGGLDDISEESEIDSEQSPATIQAMRSKKPCKLPIGGAEGRSITSAEPSSHDTDETVKLRGDETPCLKAPKQQKPLIERKEQSIQKKNSSSQKVPNGREMPVGKHVLHNNTGPAKKPVPKKHPAIKQTPKKNPPVKHPPRKSPVNSQHSRGSFGSNAPNGPRNASGMQGRNVARSKSLPEYHGIPKKTPPKKHLPMNSQHSREQKPLPRSKCVDGHQKKLHPLETNVSGVKGRGVVRSKSMPEYDGIPKKPPPKKHLPMNSQHSREQKPILQSKCVDGHQKKLRPLEASRSNHPPSKNQSGMNGRRVTVSKSMPMANAGSYSAVNATRDSDTSDHFRRKNESVKIRPILRSQTPERSVRRPRSVDQLYGKAGKIKFVPLKVPLKK